MTGRKRAIRKGTPKAKNCNQELPDRFAVLPFVVVRGQDGSLDGDDPGHRQPRREVRAELGEKGLGARAGGSGGVTWFNFSHSLSQSQSRKGKWLSLFIGAETIKTRGGKHENLARKQQPPLTGAPA